MGIVNGRPYRERRGMEGMVCLAKGRHMPHIGIALAVDAYAHADDASLVTRDIHPAVVRSCYHPEELNVGDGPTWLETEEALEQTVSLTQFRAVLLNGKARHSLLLGFAYAPKHLL